MGVLASRQPASPAAPLLLSLGRRSSHTRTAVMMSTSLKNELNLVFFCRLRTLLPRALNVTYGSSLLLLGEYAINDVHTPPVTAALCLTLCNMCFPHVPMCCWLTGRSFPKPERKSSAIGGKLHYSTDVFPAFLG